MKLLICTRCDDNIKDQTDITIPFMEDYAQRCGADFTRLSHDTDYEGDGRWHYRIMILHDLLEEYDRILHIDADAIILPSAPNIFDVVPDDKVATVFEDKGSRRAKRHLCMQTAQKLYGNVGWTEGYINTGFFLSSRCHRDIFQTIDGEMYGGWGHDDVHLGYQIAAHGFPVMELPYQWNHMTMFSEPWNGSPSRFDSHLMHYAGAGVFDRGKTKISQMRDDARRLREM